MVYSYQQPPPPPEEVEVVEVEVEEDLDVMEMAVSPLARHTPGSSSVSDSEGDTGGGNSTRPSSRLSSSQHSFSGSSFGSMEEGEGGSGQGGGPKAELTEAEKGFYKQLVKVVGKCLGKYLKAGKIAREEDHRRLTKKLAYKVLRKEKGNTEMTEETPIKIYKYIQCFFAKFPMYGNFSQMEEEQERQKEAQWLLGEETQRRKEVQEEVLASYFQRLKEDKQGGGKKRARAMAGILPN